VSKPDTSKQDAIKTEIFAVCSNLSFSAIPEYKDKGWRAELYAVKETRKVTFEIQISPQFLKKDFGTARKVYLRGSHLAGYQAYDPQFHKWRRLKNNYRCKTTGRN